MEQNFIMKQNFARSVSDTVVLLLFYMHALAEVFVFYFNYAE